MIPVRELTDTELDAVCGGRHATHHGGFTRFNDLFNGLFFNNLFHSVNGVFQSNITIQIGVALFGGSVSQTSNSTNLSIV